MTHDLDVLLHGAIGASTPDPRDPADIVSAVCAEIARGSDVTDACAASGVDPAVYLAWVHDDAFGATAAHTRAQAIRALALADAPLAIARELGAVRRGHAALPMGVSAAEVAALAKGELGSLTQAPGIGAIRARDSANRDSEVRHLVRIVFDQLPAAQAAAATLSAAPDTAPLQLTDAVPASYRVVDAPGDDD